MADAPPADGQATIFHDGSSGSLPNEDQRRQLQKLAVLGQLAGSVAHDFNNILSGALIHLNLMRQDPLLNAAQRESLANMEGELARASSVTRQLLSFSRGSGAGQWQHLDFNEVIADALKLLRGLMKEAVVFQFAPSTDEMWIEGDEELLEHLVLSLCLLAREAMPKGSVLTLSTKHEFIPRGPEKKTGVAPRETFVCLALTESSRPGQESDSDDFWDSLLTVREIVGQHRGWMEQTSPEQGARAVRIYFPAVAKPVEEPIVADDPEKNIGGTETILLVEDEAFLRKVSAISLRKLGYAVLDASDAEDAQKLWKKHRSKIDLLFTDLQLPGTQSGQDLARRMKAEKPSLKVILSSGYRTDLEETFTMAGQKLSHMVKPYTAAALARAIRARLDQPEP